MLEKIIIKNVNSIDVCELDFTKGNYRYLEENVKGDIVNPIAIYGHNGSGKSSILNAMAHFIGMMSLPAEALSP
ncbi:MAG TPA: AAA family ATPase, partial [Candidatus Enteromonas pullicola]|nr:AAA family ATPase [Candidatus Enteromonas pullicola]